MQTAKLLCLGDPDVILDVSEGDSPEIRGRGYCTF